MLLKWRVVDEKNKQHITQQHQLQHHNNRYDKQQKQHQLKQQKLNQPKQQSKLHKQHLKIQMKNLDSSNRWQTIRDDINVLDNSFTVPSNLLNYGKFNFKL